MVRDFCASTPLKPPPVDGQVPGSKRRCFTDQAWVAAWQRFHRQRVRQLRLVCHRCMLARDRGEAAEGEQQGPWPEQQQAAAQVASQAQQQAAVQAAAQAARQTQQVAPTAPWEQQSAVPAEQRPAGAAPRRLAGLVQRLAQSRVEQAPAEQVRRRAAELQQAARQEPGLAPNTFSSEELDAWLAGGPPADS